MVTIAQSAVNWRNTAHTHVDRTHSLTHKHQHSGNHFFILCEAPAQLVHILESIFILKAYLGEREQTGEYPEKKNCPLIGITYYRRKSNVPPGDGTRTLTLQSVISSLGLECAPRCCC